MSDSGKETTYTIGALEDETGLSRRTIRYYIARGLLGGPLKAGRNPVYTVQHLERLREIQRMQAEGLPLAEIALRLGDGAERAHLPSPVAFQTYSISPDVSVQVKADVSPWRMKQIRAALEEMAARLAEEGESDDDNHLGAG